MIQTNKSKLSMSYDAQITQTICIITSIRRLLILACRYYCFFNEGNTAGKQCGIWQIPKLPLGKILQRPQMASSTQASSRGICRTDTSCPWFCSTCLHHLFLDCSLAPATGRLWRSGWLLRRRPAGPGMPAAIAWFAEGHWATEKWRKGLRLELADQNQQVPQAPMQVLHC